MLIIFFKLEITFSFEVLLNLLLFRISIQFLIKLPYL